MLFNYEFSGEGMIDVAAFVPSYSFKLTEIITTVELEKDEKLRESIEKNKEIIADKIKYARSPLNARLENMSAIVDMYYEYFVDFALSIVVDLHNETYTHDGKKETKHIIKELCGERYGLPEDSSYEAEHFSSAGYSNALSIDKNANVESEFFKNHLATIESYEQGINLIIRSLVKNIYRRLHALQVPIAHYFVKCAFGISSPTTVPMDVLYNFVEFRKLPTKEESFDIMRMNPEVWMLNAQLGMSKLASAITSNPEDLFLLRAINYQKCKSIFTDNEGSPSVPNAPKTDSTVSVKGL